MCIYNTCDQSFTFSYHQEVPSLYLIPLSFNSEQVHSEISIHESISLSFNNPTETTTQLFSNSIHYPTSTSNLPFYGNFVCGIGTHVYTRFQKFHTGHSGQLNFNGVHPLSPHKQWSTSFFSSQTIIHKQCI